jgi:hypothetical protein
MMTVAASLVISAVPHPFTSREEYELAMRMPIGEEWNASHVVKEMTKPAIKVRAGRIIEPISLPKKRSHAPTDASSSSKDDRQPKQHKKQKTQQRVS